MDEPMTRGGRWVCPNDRQLALRAKLRTGWSVKTGSFESHGWGQYPNSCTSNSNRCGQSYLLTDDERKAIIQVIQRAEALDLSEQERVGRLVERLENMKRNVCIVTSTRSNERRSCGRRCSSGARCVCSCALCGEKFGAVLGASANLCKDCRKYICEKCGIEATKLNPSKGNDDGNDEVVTSSRSSLRVVRFAQERTGVQKIVQRSHGNAQKQFLCRICAETREMWKKSGAWFFKGMPKYILPEKKERGWCRPGHRTSTWTIGGPCRSVDSTDAQDSSSDDDVTRRLAVARGHSPTNLSSNRESTPTKLTISSPATSTSSSKSPRGRPNGLSPSGYRDDASSDRLDKSCLSIASQCSRISPTGSISTPRSRASGKSSNELQVEQRVSFEDILVDDEKANEADDDEEEDTEENRKDASTSLDRSKGSQTKSTHDSDDTDHTSRTIPDCGKDTPREERGTRHEQILLGSGQLFQHSQQQPSQDAKNSGISTRNGTRLWDSRSLLAIRPGRSVPPMQSGTCTSSKAHGYPRSRRSLLQAEHTARRESIDEQTTANKDGTQDTRSRVQRDGEFLRNNGNRYLDQQGIAHSNNPGRSLRSRLSGRGEISPTRIATISNETLQDISASSLSSGQRRGNLGYVFKRSRADSDKPELLHASTCATGYSAPCYESLAHGQQRVF
ncbi:PREDICTED: rabphilin-1 isoform X3 [Cyphomyrmex costatus]|uniref:rabphilin-1 isoform X3 n=1 Tax=Cyphomyrmex costatus TaxID=456900 RepID=UPI000852294B|nr:PREDICTED: rabphilin-1 isoform X3 [Cyphomyrmex costatus]